jgi:hypothetical protein
MPDIIPGLSFASRYQKRKQIRFVTNAARLGASPPFFGGLLASQKNKGARIGEPTRAAFVIVALRLVVSVSAAAFEHRTGCPCADRADTR